ncbi:MAG: hypothetical protein FJW14_15125 [Acidimicrobiia bacterium]|nr:hypothetical protein [Acidimicrobiia bacterium]
MERRDVVGGGLLGLTALLGTAGPAAAAQQRDDRETAAAIDRLRQAIEERLDSFPELTEIRTAQRTYLKANARYPEFIEIGLSVWDRLYDWHVRHQVQPAITRQDDGRYTMVFMFTTLVLRPELMDNYVGFGFDGRG